MKKYVMKSIILRIFEVLTFILIITSCEDFITENPRNRIVSTQYFLNSDDARSSVNALYYTGVPTFYAARSWTGYTSGFMDNERAEGVGPIEAQHLTMNSDNLNMQMTIGVLHKWQKLLVKLTTMNIS